MHVLNSCAHVWLSYLHTHGSVEFEGNINGDGNVAGGGRDGDVTGGGRDSDAGETAGDGGIGRNGERVGDVDTAGIGELGGVAESNGNGDSDPTQLHSATEVPLEHTLPWLASTGAPEQSEDGYVASVRRPGVHAARR